MKKRLLQIIIVFVFFSCSKNDDIVTRNKPNNPVNDFVWKAMNSWYNWQADVPNLSDTKQENQNAYYQYLNGYSSPKKLFSSLKYRADDFSWFIDDYEAQQQAFQGISKSFGFRLKAVAIDQENVIIYVRYVSPNSPADKLGIKRGNIFNSIDNIILTKTNFSKNIRKLYGSANTVKIGFTKNDGKTPTLSKTITAEIVADNPVSLVKTFDDVNGKKVGYILYNGFRSSYNDELNSAFAQLNSAGIQELILDLRINRGGSVETSANLASMIYKEADKDKFAELRFNNKHTNQNSTYSFRDTQNIYDTNGKKIGEEKINRLSGLSKLYVLTSESTASASEMIINGLRPFIDVKVVGTKTVGKNEGSITLFDLPETGYLDPNLVRDPNTRKKLIQKLKNNSHKNALQPIVFQIYNKLGQSDYSEGFEPNILVEEHRNWNNILPFGNENEVVLKAALDDIKGLAARPTLLNPNVKEMKHNFTRDKFQNAMYITGEFLMKK